MAEKDLLCGDTLEDPYDLANAILGMKAHQQMYMVLVIPELFDYQVIPLFNAFHGVAHSGDNFRSQQSLSVLHREDEVVMGVVSAVIAFGDGHPFSIAAYEGNLWFPSYSLPKCTRVAETTGKGGFYNNTNIL